MEKKIALITGANKGIGFEIATQLISKDMFVIITARNKEKGTEALTKLKKLSDDVDFIPMDVCETESVIRAAEEFKTRYDHLDILVNNAGILIDNSDIVHVEKELLLATITTNAIGPLLVTQKFMVFMKAGGRIINISSELGSLTAMGSYSPAYSISKTALNAVTRQFSSLLRSKSISVNSVCPGWVKTDMGGKGAQLTVQQGAETAVWLAEEAPQFITGKFLKNKAEIKW